MLEEIVISKDVGHIVRTGISDSHPLVAVQLSLESHLLAHQKATLRTELSKSSRCGQVTLGLFVNKRSAEALDVVGDEFVSVGVVRDDWSNGVGVQSEHKVSTVRGGFALGNHTHWSVELTTGEVLKGTLGVRSGAHADVTDDGTSSHVRVGSNSSSDAIANHDGDSFIAVVVALDVIHRDFAGNTFPSAVSGKLTEASAVNQQLSVHNVASLQGAGNAKTVGLKTRGVDLDFSHVGRGTNADYAKVANVRLSEESVHTLVGQQLDLGARDNATDQASVLARVGNLDRGVEGKESRRNLSRHLNQHIYGRESSDSRGCRLTSHLIDVDARSASKRDCCHFKLVEGPFFS